MGWLNHKVRCAVLLLFMLLLPMLLWWQYVLPRQNDLSRLQQEIDLLRNEARNFGDAEKVYSPQNQLAEVLQHLGTTEQLTARTEVLHNVLREYGIVLLKAGYKLVPSEAGGVGRYEIQLEIEAPYYAVRLFSRSMLAQDESIALESLDLQRQPGGGGKIRAAMRWVMFFKGAWR